MMRGRTGLGLFVVAITVGVAVGELAYRSLICRDAIGRLCGHGRLLALVNGRGIYHLDAQREMEADRYFAGQNANPESDGDVLPRLIASENLRRRYRNEPLPETELQREFDLTQFQFADKGLWATRLQGSGASEKSLREELQDHLRARKGIDRSLIAAQTVADKIAREFYLAHPENFAQPLRFRASHIFLAAPAGTPPDMVQLKHEAIDALAARLRGGEQFENLVWEASEDEATKTRGGDLGYFSENRIPREFFTAVSQLKVGGGGPSVVRSALGFHLVRLTDMKPARAMTFEEARPEIVAWLANEHRREAVTVLSKQLGGSSTLRAGLF